MALNITVPVFFLSFVCNSSNLKNSHVLQGLPMKLLDLFILGNRMLYTNQGFWPCRGVSSRVSQFCKYGKGRCVGSRCSWSFFPFPFIWKEKNIVQSQNPSRRWTFSYWCNVERDLWRPSCLCTSKLNSFWNCQCLDEEQPQKLLARSELSDFASLGLLLISFEDKGTMVVVKICVGFETCKTGESEASLNLAILLSGSTTNQTNKEAPAQNKPVILKFG